MSLRDDERGGPPKRPKLPSWAGKPSDFFLNARKTDDRGAVWVTCDCGCQCFVRYENVDNADDEIYRCDNCRRMVRVKCVYDDKELNVVNPEKPEPPKPREF